MKKIGFLFFCLNMVHSAVLYANSESGAGCMGQHVLYATDTVVDSSPLVPYSNKDACWFAEKLQCIGIMNVIDSALVKLWCTPECFCGKTYVDLFEKQNVKERKLFPSHGSEFKVPTDFKNILSGLLGKLHQAKPYLPKVVLVMVSGVLAALAAGSLPVTAAALLLLGVLVQAGVISETDQQNTIKELGVSQHIPEKVQYKMQDGTEVSWDKKTNSIKIQNKNECTLLTNGENTDC